MEYEGLAGAIADYINNLKKAKLDDFDKEIKKVLKDFDEKMSIELKPILNEADREIRKAKLKIERKARLVEQIIKRKSHRKQQANTYSYNQWLSVAARVARGVSFSTHPIKFTHPSAKGASSVYFCASRIENWTVNDVYLSTSTLRSPDVDVAYGDAKLAPIAKFLQVRFEKDSLDASISRGDYSALAVFAQSPEQLEGWVKGFKLALADKSLSSHLLAKQVYVPIGKQNYHLISPLFSSSLAQAIYQRIADSRDIEENKAVRDAKKNNKYSPKLAVSYPNTAVQIFGGSNAQNVSQLNSRRRGKSFLLSSAPPTWQTQLKPPVNSKSIFIGEYDRRARYQAGNLQQYLLSISKCDGNMPMRQQIGAYLNELLDTLFNYAAEVQSMTQFTGWSAHSKLKRAQQMWLDPYRNDPLFQEERAKGDWQLRIADDFAFWLKRKLKHEQLVFGEVEHQEWLRFLSHRLREFEADLPEVSR